MEDKLFNQVSGGVKQDILKKKNILCLAHVWQDPLGAVLSTANSRGFKCRERGRDMCSIRLCASADTD